MFLHMWACRPLFVSTYASRKHAINQYIYIHTYIWICFLIFIYLYIFLSVCVYAFACKLSYIFLKHMLQILLEAVMHIDEQIHV